MVWVEGSGGVRDKVRWILKPKTAIGGHIKVINLADDARLIALILSCIE